MPRQYTPRVNLICHHCNTAFDRPPSMVRSNKRQFCSKSCYTAWQHTAEGFDTLSKIKQSRTVIRTCEQCRKQFRKPMSRVSAGRGRFCSRACQRAFHAEGINADGYVRVFVRGHHRAINGYVLQHIIVAEEKIRRRLEPGEVVHHIDGDKTNNHPGNLMVMTRSEHARLHAAQRRESSLA